MGKDFTGKILQMDRCRLRITFAKGDALRYISHLDLLRVWERSLRRAGAPLAYSQGFNPRPRLQLAAALPLGHTGEAEWLDVWLEGPAPLAGRLTAALPAGLTVHAVRPVDPYAPALQTQIAAAEYAATIELPPEAAEELPARLADVLAAAELPHEQRGRRYNLRPLIERLWLEPADMGNVTLGMQLAAREGATARPEAVLDVLGLGGMFARYCRRRLIVGSPDS